MRPLLIACLLLFPLGVFAQNTIPAGTILPAELQSSLNSAKSRPGQIVTARIMQDVPLPGRKKIPAGSKILGHVVTAKPASAGAPGELTIRFEEVGFKHQSPPIDANLRALASVTEVEYAQVPTTGPDRGTPYAWTTRELIGGEVVYGEGGPVARGMEVVGKFVPGGGALAPVEGNSGFDRRGGIFPLVSRSGAFSPALRSPCRGDVSGNHEPQALWVFSTDACGVYGIGNVAIAHAGRTEPRGEITLGAKQGDVKIERGSGILLRVNSNSR